MAGGLSRLRETAPRKERGRPEVPRRVLLDVATDKVWWLCCRKICSPVFDEEFMEIRNRSICLDFPGEIYTYEFTREGSLRFTFKADFP
jgi:hypothetical protein